MLLVCVHSYLKSFLRYKFLILDTCHPETPYLHEQGCVDLWLFFETKRGPPAKKFGKPCPGMLHCVPGQEVTNVVKDNSVFIFEIDCTANLPNIANHLLSVQCCGVTFQQTCIFSNTTVRT